MPSLAPSGVRLPVILQSNANHSGHSQGVLRQITTKYSANLLLISEPHVPSLPSYWPRSLKGNAAVGVVTPRVLPITGVFRGDHFVSVSLPGVEVFCVYMPPRLSIANYEVALDALEHRLRQAGCPVIISGDWNARSPLWNDTKECTRGRLLSEWAARLALVIVDTGTAPTCIRWQGSSRVDQTLVSPSIRLSGRVLPDETTSDHSAILLHPARDSRLDCVLPQHRWAFGKANPERVREAWTRRWTGPPHQADADQMVVDLCSAAAVACDEAVGRRKAAPHHRPQYWWNDEIARLHRCSTKTRRQYQRAPRGSHRGIVLYGAWKTARVALKVAIQRSKENSWRSLICDLDNDPWGLAYKIVRKKLRVPIVNPRLSDASFVTDVVSTLFPTGSPVSEVELQLDTEPPLFTQAELRQAVTRCCARNGAPGLDGIPSKIWRYFLEADSRPILTTLNGCLREGKFPLVWKTSRLVLLPKPGKPLDAPNSYRPLCLEDDISKIFERMILQRLESALDRSGGLHPNQFGFRKGRGTVDALSALIQDMESGLNTSGIGLIVSVDVQNAFNSVEWKHIFDVLAFRNIPLYLQRMIRSYLSERTVVYTSPSGVERRFPVTRGVPQGSVLGPWLWNLAYDELLWMPLPTIVTSQCYADDLVLYGYASNSAAVTQAMNRALDRVQSWLRGRNLRTAASKCEVLVVSRRSNLYPTEQLVMDGTPLHKTDLLRYLGIYLDRRLTFAQHIEVACAKAAKATAEVGRLLPNVGGPKASRRRLLCSVATSVLMYGAPIWGKVFWTAKTQRLLEGSMRVCAQRISCSYRTTSTAVSHVLGRTIPGTLLARERADVELELKGVPRPHPRRLLRAVKQTARKKTEERWQNEWDKASTWAHTLIPELRPWLQCRQSVNFYSAMALTGHGSFGSYLHRIGRRPSPECAACGADVDDPYHALYQCPRSTGHRATLESDLSRLGVAIPDWQPGNFAAIIFTSRDHAKVVFDYLTCVMRERFAAERYQPP